MERTARLSLKNKLDKKIGNYLINNVFSACSVAYIRIRDDKTEKDCICYGSTEIEKSGVRIDENTIFDLASLTKPLVTTLSVMVLIEEGKITVDDTLERFFRRNLAGNKNINIYHLLTHSSGLPAHKKYYKDLINIPENRRKMKIVDWILQEKVCSAPGVSSIYSDLGFILLGEIVERVSGESLDVFWERVIAAPLGLENDLYFIKNKKDDDRLYAKTGWCGWANNELSGMVHDDNCRALGGVAGHAGLFGSAEAVLRLCENIMIKYYSGLDSVVKNKQTLDIFFTKKTDSSWALGFDTPSGLKSSSGTYFSEKSVGHLGFTGTSFWMDLNEGICIVLLTNRVLCGDNLESIRAVRPVIHDTIMEHLKKKG